MKYDSMETGAMESRRDRMLRELTSSGMDGEGLAGLVRFVAAAALGSMVTLWATGHGTADPASRSGAAAQMPITGPLEFAIPVPVPEQAAPEAASPRGPETTGSYDMSQHDSAGDGGGGGALQSY